MADDDSDKDSGPLRCYLNDTKIAEPRVYKRDTEVQIKFREIDFRRLGESAKTAKLIVLKNFPLYDILKLAY